MNIFAILGYIIVLILVGISLGGFSYMYVDFPSLLFTLAFLLLTLYGTGTMKDFLNGLKIGLRFKKSYSMLELKKAHETLHMVMRNMLISGSIICLMSLISILYHMDSPHSIGPAIAMGMLCILYSLIIALILTPFKVRIHMLLIAYAEEDQSKEEKLNEEALEQRVYYLFRSKGLTDREAEIARLVSQEMTNREISSKLFISEATVKKHITHILDKLELQGREAIAEFISKNT